MHAFSWACAWNGQIIFVGYACALVHDGLICGHLLLDSDVLGGGKERVGLSFERNNWSFHFLTLILIYIK